MCQPDVLDERVQLSLRIQPVTGQLYLAKLLHVAPIPVSLVPLRVILAHDATAARFEEVDHQIHSIVKAVILRAFNLPAHLCFVAVIHFPLRVIFIIIISFLIYLFEVESLDVRLFEGEVLVVSENELAKSEKGDGLASYV